MGGCILEPGMYRKFKSGRMLFFGSAAGGSAAQSVLRPIEVSHCDLPLGEKSKSGEVLHEKAALGGGHVDFGRERGQGAHARLRKQE